MTLTSESVDLRSIGWWFKDLDDREFGPYSRDSIRDFQSWDLITRDGLVRHNLDLHWKPVVESLGPSPETPEAGRLSELPVGREAEPYREGPLACIRHPGTRAITACFRCLGPVCGQCQQNPQHRMCRVCSRSLYYRRVLAGVVDYVVPTALSAIVVFVIGRVLLSASYDYDSQLLASALGALKSTAVMLGLATTAYLVFKEQAMTGGRSFGKALVGLRVVSFDTGEPLSVVQCVKRNLLPAFCLVPILGFMAEVWWFFDCWGPWWDPLQRRYFDRFANTWVVDSPERLNDVRSDTALLVTASRAKDGGPG